MPGGGLKSDQVIPLLASTNDIDQDTANWLLKQHPEWGDDLAGWFTRAIRAVADDADEAR